MPIEHPKLVDGYNAVPLVKTRNKNAMISFSGYWSAYALPEPPTPPSDDIIRNIIAAGRIPAMVDSYVQQTMVYFMQDPATGTNIHELLNEYNPDGVETTLSTSVRSVLDAFASRWLKIEVTEAQVEQWKTDHGYVEPVEPAVAAAGNQPRVQ